MDYRKIIFILRVLSTFNPFERFTYQLPSSPKLAAGGSLLVKEFTDEDFCKVFVVSRRELLKHLLEASINQMQKTIFFNTFGVSLLQLIFHQV